MSKQIALVLVALIVVAGGSFFGGMKYADSKKPAGPQTRADFQNLSPEERQARIAQFGQGGMARNGGTGGGMRGGLTAGEIIAKDNTTMTVKMPNGSSRIVLYSASTSVLKAEAGTFLDLSIGSSVVVTGSLHPDGSVWAERIQLSPK